MEPESLYNLLQLPSEVALPTEELLPQGAKKKYLPPNSRKDPKFEELQKVHNVTLALELLRDAGLLSHPVSPEDIVNKDPRSTLRVLYSLFCKHQLKASADGTPCGTLH
ncbi:gamma-parvin [Callospermophilus lateralis]